MADFRRVTDSFWVSPQITIEELEDAAKRGFQLVINNRPDGESPDQPDSFTVELAARKHGMDYVSIPVTHAGFSHDQIDRLQSALENSDGPVLAFCRSGTRSTLLWALAEAANGTAIESIAANAEQAGYDVTPITAMMDMLANSKK